MFGPAWKLIDILGIYSHLFQTNYNRREKIFARKPEQGYDKKRNTIGILTQVSKYSGLADGSHHPFLGVVVAPRGATKNTSAFAD